MNIKKHIHITSLVIVLILLFTTVVYAINQSNTLKKETKSTEIIEVTTESDIKDKEGLSKEEILKLVAKGYNIYDIPIAEELAELSDKDIEKVLEMKGKKKPLERKNKTLQKSENKKKYKIIINSEGEEEKVGIGTHKTNNSISQPDDYYRDYEAEVVKSKYIDKHKTWEEVEEELGVRRQTIAEKNGMSREKVNELKKAGYPERIINSIAVIANKYNKGVDEILSSYKEKKSIKYVQEELMINKYKVTREKLEKIKDEGVNKLEEIEEIIIYSQKAKKSIDEIIKIKKETQERGDVKKALEVTENEENN